MTVAACELWLKKELEKQEKQEQNQLETTAVTGKKTQKPEPQDKAVSNKNTDWISLYVSTQ